MSSVGRAALLCSVGVGVSACGTDDSVQAPLTGQEAGARCNGLGQFAAEVPERLESGAVPVLGGGSVVQGVYMLTFAALYGGSGAERSVAETLQLTPGSAEAVYGAAPGTSATYDTTASGTTLTWTVVCSDEARGSAQSLDYEALPDGLQTLRATGMTWEYRAYTRISD